MFVCLFMLWAGIRSTSRNLWCCTLAAQGYEWDLWLLKGLTVKEAFGMYVNGKNIQGDNITLADQLERGLALQTIRGSWFNLLRGRRDQGNRKPAATGLGRIIHWIIYKILTCVILEINYVQTMIFLNLNVEMGFLKSILSSTLSPLCKLPEYLSGPVCWILCHQMKALLYPFTTFF